MTRILPDTSHEANRRATDEMREAHHAKIIAALQELGIANYEIIGAKCGLERHAIGRRLCELERALIIFKPGSKSLTKSNRHAFDYCLTSSNQVKTEVQQKEVTYSKDIKTAADHAIDLIKSTQLRLL